jgi:hypothetical protein
MCARILSKPELSMTVRACTIFRAIFTVIGIRCTVTVIA